ncbi:PREDICTED: uncharacterized protein LOC108366561 [Rhagoletis zephyria]|uniref:uncharacterized protein LOC108366561 n=1 Tax=Rhagoletis zephyria TaxID=28612 RepID=UPI0008119C63|nr:PREDICTED: uncharacterized protein LOC108366561 [Rhagoletis zephyria]XP_017476485.1 PREDICTED: uncharacterized protein LOC108366561 [Rhagoletis zephyria]XP_017476486.1 PREDICTED: uncharacterized protein LOC108366561 [Rhagoletis zephyria]XP_017476487.1 PREDICTED: uncharacterized protein LOC108366561 [Rhagoletis zephyria]
MSVYNVDELVAPAWMNEEFFGEVLRNLETGDGIKIIKLDISPASMKGDHFASIMFRAKIEYKTTSQAPSSTISLIVKTLTDGGEKCEMLEQSRMFQTEINMYKNTLPRIAEVLAEHGDSIVLAPKMLYSTLEPRQIIILEDLSENGYTVMRNRFPTDDEMKAIYRKLAKVHAVSYAIGQSEDHEVVTQHQEGLFSSEFILEYELFKTALRNFIDLLTTHDEFSEYLPKFQVMEKDILRRCHKLFNVYKNGIKNEVLVINHGDFHLKNLMFRFDEKSQMQDFMLLDFHLSVYAPPIVDLIYSKYAMCSSAMRDNYDVYLRSYFEQFNETLKLIDYKGELLKYCDLKISALRYRHFTVFIITLLLPILYSVLILSPEELKDKDSSKVFNEHNGATSLFYRNPKLITELRKLLPIHLCEGYLD